VAKKLQQMRVAPERSAEKNFPLERRGEKNFFLCTQKKKVANFDLQQLHQNCTSAHQNTLISLRIP
jgi:hypothetical protein